MGGASRSREIGEIAGAQDATLKLRRRQCIFASECNFAQNGASGARPFTLSGVAPKTVLSVSANVSCLLSRPRPLFHAFPRVVIFLLVKFFFCFGVRLQSSPAAVKDVKCKNCRGMGYKRVKLWCRRFFPQSLLFRSTHPHERRIKKGERNDYITPAAFIVWLKPFGCCS